MVCRNFDRWCCKRRKINGSGRWGLIKKMSRHFDFAKKTYTVAWLSGGICRFVIVTFLHEPARAAFAPGNNCRFSLVFFRYPLRINAVCRFPRMQQNWYYRTLYRISRPMVIDLPPPTSPPATLNTQSDPSSRARQNFFHIFLIKCLDKPLFFCILPCALIIKLSGRERMFFSLFFSFIALDFLFFRATCAVLAFYGKVFLRNMLDISRFWGMIGVSWLIWITINWPVLLTLHPFPGYTMMIHSKAGFFVSAPIVLRSCLAGTLSE